jgi:hypothetical protein
MHEKHLISQPESVITGRVIAPGADDYDTCPYSNLVAEMRSLSNVIREHV